MAATPRAGMPPALACGHCGGLLAADHEDADRRRCLSFAREVSPPGYAPAEWAPETAHPHRESMENAQRYWTRQRRFELQREIER